MRKSLFLLAIFVFSAVCAISQDITQGSLYAADKKGKELGACPLKRTTVRADVSGFITRVKVTQEFENDFSEPVEAVYTFPLSQTAAVDQMTMKIGDRIVRGSILRREEARRVYQTAKNEGKTASLLDEERPNVFTQSIANILPNEKILIEISYVETLQFEDGAYEFVFPMVVGPRYVPASDKTADKDEDEDESDAENVSPPIDATRAGHDISIEVNLEAGIPIEEIRSHEIETSNLSPTSAKVSLRSGETIPNKDFVLRYDVTGKRIEDAILTHWDERGGFFTLMLQPPDKFAAPDVTPKEIVFVLDTSGSMDGFPIEKAKEAIRLSLANLYPYDTFNLITFAGETEILFEKPVLATQANMEKALWFLDEKESGGGTEIMKAIKAALEPTDSQEHLRVVCFMTDGYVSNEPEIIAEVQKHPQARVFSFGIGDSVNRYLLDKIAHEGRGEVEYVALEDDGERAAKRFYERVRTPLLTDISIDWNDLPVADVYPNKISDLFSAKPVILHGRYTKASSGTIRLKGKMAGQDYVREIAVNFPENAPNHDVLPTLWARTKIDDLTNQSYRYDADADGYVADMKAKIRNDIVGLSLKYNVLTELTSFVAVEERIVTGGGKTRKIKVPVYVPAGTESGEGDGIGEGSGNGGGSGNGNGMGSGNNSPTVLKSVSRPLNGLSNADQSAEVEATPVPRTVSGGVINSKAVELVKPIFPAAARAVRASGEVVVQILIDENGNVIFAKAVSGHALLRAASEKAARQSRFSPTVIGGKAMRVTGVIVYNFVGAENSTPAVATGDTSADEKDVAALAEQMRLETEKGLRDEIAEKLHFWIFALVERLQKNESAPTPNETKFVNGGKADVELRLTTKSAAAFNRLRELGFEIVEDKKAKIVVGRIGVEKLVELTRIAEVQYVVPKIK